MCNDEAERYYGYGAELESFLPVAAECDEQGGVILGPPDVLPWADEIVSVVDVDDIDTDLQYAIRQLRRADPGLDCVRRALDALERIDHTCQAAAEAAAGF